MFISSNTIKSTVNECFFKFWQLSYFDRPVSSSCHPPRIVTLANHVLFINKAVVNWPSLFLDRQDPTRFSVSRNSWMGIEHASISQAQSPENAGVSWALTLSLNRAVLCVKTGFGPYLGATTTFFGQFLDISVSFYFIFWYFFVNLADKLI